MIYKTERKIKPEKNWGSYLRNKKFKANLHNFFGLTVSKPKKSTKIKDVKDIETLNQFYGSKMFLDSYAFPF